MAIPNLRYRAIPLVGGAWSCQGYADLGTSTIGPLLLGVFFDQPTAPAGGDVFSASMQAKAAAGGMAAVYGGTYEDDTTEPFE